MKVLSVSEITKAIKNLLEGAFKDDISVEGEISNLSRSPSGHLYFVLKDANAQIRVVFFKKFSSINRNYTPKNGDQVVVLGELSLYEPDGVYQIVAKKIEYSSYGIFYKKYEETKRKLEAEGLFDSLHKKQIPMYVKKIAVLTSPSGAAIKDFLKILRDNGIGIEIDLWGVQVQGVSAINEIVDALGKAGKMSDYDLLILMRGGGSLEDLAIFNEEVIARALADCDIPTITAIGHERDYTIVDLVADLRAPTPTAAANVLVKNFEQLKEILSNADRSLSRFMENKLYRISQKIDNLSIRLDKNSPISRLQKIETFLRLCDETLKNNISTKINDIKAALDYYYAMLHKNSPKIKINIAKRDLIHLRERLKKDIFRRVSFTYDTLSRYEAILRNLNPQNLLKKGYCIVLKDNMVVSDVRDVSLEDNLEIRMKNGYINASVAAKKIVEEHGG